MRLELAQCIDIYFAYNYVIVGPALDLHDIALPRVTVWCTYTTIAVCSIVALNDIGEPVSASLALVGNSILIRGESHLFCIEAR